MSVIVRTPGGKIKVMTKGADNVIFERLAPDQDDQTSETLNHLKIFASEGIYISYIELSCNLDLKKSFYI